MKKFVLIAIALLFPAHAALAQDSKPVAKARQALAELRSCESDHVMRRYKAIVEMVLPEQIGTTHEEILALTSDCLEKRFDPHRLIANIRNGKDRNKSWVRLEFFFRESDADPAALGLTRAETAKLTEIANMRLGMLGRSITYPTWYPRQR